MGVSKAANVWALTFIVNQNTPLMKTNFIFPMIFILAAGRVTAQECATFFPFDKGAALEYTHYDDKGKVMLVSNQKVVMIDDAGADGLTAQVDVVMLDKNGKEQTKGNYKVTCKASTLYMDITATMPQMTQSFSQMEMQMTGDQLQLPAKLSVGQALPDAHMEIKAGSGGVNLMKMTIDVTERKVEGKEMITTPTGAYEAYKISYMTSTKMLVGKNFKTIAWYAPKVGMVKQESYDKKGNLENSMVLTKFSKQ